jgi:hypothetical protein
MKRYNDAINICLTTIGESPIPANTSIQPYCTVGGTVTDGVCSLPAYTTDATCSAASGVWTLLNDTNTCSANSGTWTEGHYEGLMADTTITEAQNEILSEGFQFNTDENWELVPDTQGYITIPANVLSVDGTSRGDDLITREGKLYNKATNSYIFTTPQSVTIVWDLSFDTLPIPMQTVITASGKLKLYTRIVGVDSMVTQLERELQAARSLMITEDLRSGDYSIFDDVSTSRFNNRTQNPIAI